PLWYTTEHKIEVRTTIDGEVLQFLVSSTGHLVQPWYSPMDFIAGARLAVALSSFGVRMASSLIRKATAKLEARATLNGATKSLAREAEEAAAKKTGARGLTEGGLVSFPVSRKASKKLSGAQMETLLRDALNKRPYLARLRAAQRLDGTA